MEAIKNNPVIQWVLGAFAIIVGAEFAQAFGDFTDAIDNLLTALQGLLGVLAPVIARSKVVPIRKLEGIEHETGQNIVQRASSMPG